MIDHALSFLRRRLETHLASVFDVAGEPHSDRVGFPLHEDQNAVTLKHDVVSVVLVNIEQERVLRADDPFLRRLPGVHDPKATALEARGKAEKRRVQPDLRLDLHVLFVAHFINYETGLSYLSEVIRCFQARPVYDRDDSDELAGREGIPELPESVDRLVLELITLPLQQQNDLWNALRTAYRPSVLYRVRLAVFRDEGVSAEQSVDPDGVVVRVSAPDASTETAAETDLP